MPVGDRRRLAHPDRKEKLLGELWHLAVRMDGQRILTRLAIGGNMNPLARGASAPVDGGPQERGTERLFLLFEWNGRFERLGIDGIG